MTAPRHPSDRAAPRRAVTIEFWSWVARWFLWGSPEGRALDVIEQRLTTVNTPNLSG